MIREYFIDESMYFLRAVKDYNFTTDSQITDRDPVLTDEEINALKKITLNNMTFSEPYAPDERNPSSLDVFNIGSSQEPDLKVVVSNRNPTNGELRGRFLRDLLTQAKKENSDQTVFDAIQSKVTTLEYNIFAITGGLLSFSEEEKLIANHIFNHHKNGAYNNDEEMRQALLETAVVVSMLMEEYNVSVDFISKLMEKKDAIPVISRLIKAKNLFEIALIENNDVLTESTRDIFNKLTQTLQDFSSGKLLHADLTKACITLGNEINQLEINKYQGYTGIKKVLSTIAFLLLSVLSFGVANAVSYRSQGSFIFFKGDNNKFREQQTVEEVGRLFSLDNM